MFRLNSVVLVVLGYSTGSENDEFNPGVVYALVWSEARKGSGGLRRRGPSDLRLGTCHRKG